MPLVRRFKFLADEAMRRDLTLKSLKAPGQGFRVRTASPPARVNGFSFIRLRWSSCPKNGWRRRGSGRDGSALCPSRLRLAAVLPPDRR